MTNKTSGSSIIIPFSSSWSLNFFLFSDPAIKLDSVQSRAGLHDDHDDDHDDDDDDDDDDDVDDDDDAE